MAKVLITGTSKGIGYDTTLLLARGTRSDRHDAKPGRV
jgi:short-subunit dehydrogenase